MEATIKKKKKSRKYIEWIINTNTKQEGLGKSTDIAVPACTARDFLKSHRRQPRYLRTASSPLCSKQSKSEFPLMNSSTTPIDFPGTSSMGIWPASGKILSLLQAKFL